MAEYDHMAQDYQKVVRNLESPVVMPELYTFTQMIGDLSGLSILDLGCGEGIYTRRIAQLQPARIMGADISAEMVGLARQEEARNSLGIEYRVTDARQMESLGEFDMVTSFFMLNHAQTREELLNMCQSIAGNLRSGGRFFGFNNNLETAPKHYPLMEKYGRRQQAPDPLFEGAPIQVWHFDGEEECSFTDFYLRRESYEWAFRQAGFGNTTWHKPLVDPEHVAHFGKDFWQDYFDYPTMVVLESVKL